MAASLAVYLYGEAAQTAGRRSLPAIRAGEYEALPEKVRVSSSGWAGVGALLLPFPTLAGHPSREGHSSLSGVFPQLKQAEWVPDFGPSSFVPSWGATVTGARKFLIAFNINLLGTKEQAHRIALNLREQGRGKDKVSSRRSPQGLAPSPGNPGGSWDRARGRQAPWCGPADSPALVSPASGTGRRRGSGDGSWGTLALKDIGLESGRDAAIVKMSQHF